MAISVLKRRITDFMQRIIETLNLDPEDIAITRRFFVMNSFDGSLTMFGIIVGSWVSGVRNPSKIVGTGLGACLAMGVSGMVGAYASERAESIRKIKQIENAMLVSLSNSDISKTTQLVSLFSAVVDGVS